eukprot:g33127.t1
MAANVPTDVDVGGMVGEDKVDPITAVGGKTGSEGRSAGDGSDLVEGPVNYSAGEPSVEEERDISEATSEVGIIRTDATEM